MSRNSQVKPTLTSHLHIRLLIIHWFLNHIIIVLRYLQQINVMYLDRLVIYVPGVKLFFIIYGTDTGCDILEGLSSGGYALTVARSKVIAELFFLK